MTSLPTGAAFHDAESPPEGGTTNDFAVLLTARRRGLFRARWAATIPDGFACCGHCADEGLALMSVAYETRMSDDLHWALREGSMFFEQKGGLHATLQKIARRLGELEIPYAVAGGMALFVHGFRRFTEDVDILVTPEGLERLHRELEGLGYTPLFRGSKNLRDADSGVRIEFLVTGDFPGDGKPKPVAFPDPRQASIERDGIRWLDLPALVELKLASGMTAPDRLKNLADVQELIRLLQLPADFAEKLQPFVRQKYGELWRSVAKA